MKNTNPKKKKITISKDYVKGFMLDTSGVNSVKKLLDESKEIYCLNTEDYQDGTGSVTVTIHFND